MNKHRNILILVVLLVALDLAFVLLWPKTNTGPLISSPPTKAKNKFAPEVSLAPSTRVETPSIPAVKASQEVVSGATDNANKPSSPIEINFGPVEITDGVMISRTLATGEQCDITPSVLPGDQNATPIALKISIYSTSGEKIFAPGVTMLAGHEARISTTSPSHPDQRISIRLTPYMAGTPPPEPQTYDPHSDPFAQQK